MPSVTKELVVFYLIACIGSWSIWGYNVYCYKSGSCETDPMATLAGSIGPFLGAVLVTLSRSGFHGVKQMFESAYKYDAKSWRWILMSVILPFIAFLSAGFSYRFLGDGPEVHFDLILFLQSFILGLAVFPFEEIGWRSFALPRLLEVLKKEAPSKEAEPAAKPPGKGLSNEPKRLPIKRSRSKAEDIVIPSLVAGTMLGIWHLPLFLYSHPFMPSDYSLRGISQELMYFTTGFDLLSILMTILWMRTNKSTSTGVLFRATVTASLAAMGTRHLGKLFSWLAMAVVPIVIVVLQQAKL